jgi:hypothetical protein
MSTLAPFGQCLVEELNQQACSRVTFFSVFTNSNFWGETFRQQTFVGPGLPDFPWSKHTKMRKIYQTTTHYTKLP